MYTNRKHNDHSATICLYYNRQKAGMPGKRDDCGHRRGRFSTSVFINPDGYA